MFEEYKRLTSRDNIRRLCHNCSHKDETCAYWLMCPDAFSEKLNQFENALEDGRLIELTEERITALMACLHAASTNRKVEEATYVKFRHRDDGRIETLRTMRYDEAVDLLAGLLENLSDKEEEIEK